MKFFEFNSKHIFKSFRLLVIFILVQQKGIAQIIPPGSSNAHTASWLSVALSQKLDTHKNKSWKSVTYIGMAFKSNPDNYNLFQKPSIFIINQEFYRQFYKHWQYSLAISYLNQNQYKDSFPFEKKDPAYKQEFRFYGRISYSIKRKRITFSPAFRQEFRKYYTPDFKKPAEDLQLRSRIRLQLSVSLGKHNVHKITAYSEQLFSTKRKSNTNTWSKFAYSDSRFSIYYSLSPQNLPVTFNIGYMNNLIGNNKPYAVHHAAFDITINNPFHLKKR